MLNLWQRGVVFLYLLPELLQHNYDIVVKEVFYCCIHDLYLL